MLRSFFIYLPRRSLGDYIRAFFERSEEEGGTAVGVDCLAIAHTTAGDIQLDNK
jgi:hypothetical protein